MWAVGCVIAELVGRVPFFPGSDSKKQLELIVDVLGKPGAGFLSQVRKPACRDQLAFLPTSARKELKDVIGKARVGAKAPLAAAAEEITPGAHGVSPDVLTMLDGLLVWEPLERLTAKDCLQNPYFNSSAPQMASFESTNGETDASPYSLNMLGDTNASAEFAFEHRKMAFDELRGELLGEAKHYIQSTDVVLPKAPLAIGASASADALNEAAAATEALSAPKDSQHVHTPEPSDARTEEEKSTQNESSSSATEEGVPRNLHWARGLCADTSDFAPRDEHAGPHIDTGDPRRLANRLAAAQGNEQVAEASSGCLIL